MTCSGWSIRRAVGRFTGRNSRCFLIRSALPSRITFEDEAAVPFDLGNGKLDADVLSSDDQLLQDLWRTYFKAICIKQRMNPRKQLQDMPRRYWKYMTEKQ